MHPAERGELEAFRDLYRAAPEKVGAVVEELDGAVCIALPALRGSAMFNRVLGLGLQRPASEETLDEIAAHYRRLDTEWCVSLAPQAKPSALPEWLERRGLASGYGWAKFRRGVADPPPARTELHVEPAGQDDAEAFAEVFVRGYGVPELFRDWIACLPERDGWHCFVAWDGQEPAAAGALFVAGSVGWLGMAATLPEQRRRGAQSAILKARLEAAAAVGCEAVVTETGELREGRPSHSYRNIVRAGFEPEYVRPNYLSSPEADTSGRSG
jgi:GNAT superfamily N-acetyltransferase